jgi:hypothetical protein
MTYILPPEFPPAFPGLQRVRGKTRVRGGGKLRRRWIDESGNIYEWDSQHGRLEKYNARGKHLGEFDPESGVLTKPADPRRVIEP